MKTTATFQVTGWDEKPYDEPDGGPRLSQATVTKSFSGGMEGASTAQVLMCVGDPTDPSRGAGYIASDKVRGKSRR